MSRLRRSSPWVIGAALLTAQPAAADKPGKVAIGPESPKGALLFKVMPWPAVYQLNFIRDKEPGFFSSNLYPIGIEPVRDAGERFVVETLPPGRYHLEAVFQQSRWGACLEAKTFAVSIQAGKIAYLGTVDVRQTLASIPRLARQNHDMTAGNFEWHLYRTGIAVPDLTDRDPQALARAATFVREHMPKSSAATELAPVEWAPYTSTGATGPDRCV
jgi:hypothetical protein